MSRVPFVTEGVLDVASDINSSLKEVDGIITSRVVDFVTAPPSNVSDKARYGISAGASGAFLGKDGQIGVYVAEGDFWNFYSPLHVFQDNMLYVSNGYSWTPVEGRLENKGKVVQTKGQSIYDVMSQKSVTDEINTKADTSYTDTELFKKVDKVTGQSLFKDTERTKLSEIATGATKNRSDAEMDIIWNTKVDKVVGKELSDTNFTQVEKTKLSGVAVGATKNETDAQLRARASHTGEQPISTVTSLQSTLDSKVDKIAGKGLSTSDFTPAEKAKLASLESSKYRGSYPSLAALQAANPSPSAGEYADVDSGVGKDTTRWIWDNTDSTWIDLGAAPALTPAQVKALYEENGNTNAYTDAEKTKLSGIATGATKNATDAQLRARASHTGTQAISTVVGLQAGLDSKVDKVAGKELSANDFTNVLKTKVDSLPSGVGGLIPLSAGGTGATSAATARTALQLGNHSTHNYGTTANTVMRGNDSRANNGQTAFSWGNHASAGYALEGSLNYVVGTGLALANGKLDINFGTVAGTVVEGNDSRVNNGQAAFNRLNIGATAATARAALELGAGATRWPTWTEVTSKPSTFTPSSHTHAWSQVTGQPATATRWPTFAEVTDKPATYAPSGHTHPWAQVTGQPATATRWPTFAEVTDKPSTYAPSGHTHPVSQITGLGSAATSSVVQTTGTSTTNLMSQKAVTDAFSLRENIKVTVGSGGDFPTINAAVLHLSRFTPDNGVTAEVELRSGFVVREQLFVEGLDLGWITITGVDAETVINEPSLTRVLFEEFKPAFGVMRGTLPTIGQLFSFSSKGVQSDSRSGVIAYSVGRATILEGCGVKNAGQNGIFAYGGSTINANLAIASGAGNHGIFAYGGSTISANLAIASGAGSHGIHASDGSFISATLVNASGAGTYGIFAYGGSTINANLADASGAGNHGIQAYGGSTINAHQAIASGAGGSGIHASDGSFISATLVNASGAGTYGITIASGSIVNAVAATGTLSQAVNTSTHGGIIFK